MKYLLIAIAAGLLFIPFLGIAPLFDPLETAFANAAREMISSGHYAVIHAGPGPVYDKFPLFIWMQAGSMELFGMTPFAARFPNALMGVLTLLTLYAIGKKQADSNLGVWWALVYAACWLPHLWFKSGLPAPVYNYFIFLSAYLAYRAGYAVKPLAPLLAGGMCLGLAVLTKGPAPLAAILLGWLLYWVLNRGKTSIRFRHICLMMLFACLPLAFWLLYIGIMQGWAYPADFCRYQAGTLSNAWRYRSFYYQALLPGSFPAIVFLLGYLQKRRQRSVYTTPQPLDMKDLHIWMWALCWASLACCPSFVYLPLSFLVARLVYRIAEGRATLKRWVITWLLVMGILMGIILMLLPLAGVYGHVWAGDTSHPLLKAWMQADVHWGWWEIIYGLLYILLMAVSASLLFRKNYQGGLLLLFIGTIIIIQLTLLHFAPKIEKLLAASL